MEQKFKQFPLFRLKLPNTAWSKAKFHIYVETRCLIKDFRGPNVMLAFLPPKQGLTWRYLLNTQSTALSHKPITHVPKKEIIPKSRNKTVWTRNIQWNNDKKKMLWLKKNKTKKPKKNTHVNFKMSCTHLNIPASFLHKKWNIKFCCTREFLLLFR